MKRIIAPLIFLLCVGISYSQETKLCKTVQKDETTCWGWIQGHTAVNGGTVKKIRGKVVDPTGEPVIDALIEVFDNPDLDFDKRKRIAACRTDKNGEFSFEGLAADKYELRGSYCRGFDAGHTIVTLAPKKQGASKAEIMVTLNLSQ